MDQHEARAMGERILNEARAPRAAFPNAATLRHLPVSGLPITFGVSPPLLAALRCLRDEVLLVRAGKAVDLTVLNDVIACIECFLPGL